MDIFSLLTFFHSGNYSIRTWGLLKQYKLGMVTNYLAKPAEFFVNKQTTDMTKAKLLQTIITPKFLLAGKMCLIQKYVIKSSVYEHLSDSEKQIEMCC